MPKSPSLTQLRAALHRLDLEQARQLYAELGTHIQLLEQQTSTTSTETKGREVVETQHLGNRLYQLERIRCGKAGCKCAGENGVLHGPYWYAYWREAGRLKSRYIGKRLRQIEQAETKS